MKMMILALPLALAGCASPFHRYANFYFRKEPESLETEGLCHQFYNKPSCCGPAYTVTLEAYVRSVMAYVKDWDAQGKKCATDVMRLYAGAACSLCDPEWERYSVSTGESGKWVVSVAVENCDYIWESCKSRVTVSQDDFCAAVTNMGDDKVFSNLLEGIQGSAAIEDVPKKEHVEVEEAREAEAVTRTASIVHHRKTQSLLSAGRRKRKNATQFSSTVSDLPFPPLLFSPFQTALSAVDEGDFAGFVEMQKSFSVPAFVFAVFAYCL